MVEVLKIVAVVAGGAAAFLGAWGLLWPQEPQPPALAERVTGNDQWVARSDSSRVQTGLRVW